MRALAVLGVAALLACVAAGCSSPGHPAAAGPAPLGSGSASGDLCWDPRAGSVITDAEVIDHNSSAAPVTLTGASLAGTRDIRLDGTYADVFDDGTPPANGNGSGWPPAALRHHLAGTIVPPGRYVQLLYTVTARTPLAFAAGEVISYISKGESWTQRNPWATGRGPECPKR
jgi:hypothetical protein